MLVIFAGDVLLDCSRQGKAVRFAEGQEEDVAGSRLAAQLAKDTVKGGQHLPSHADSEQCESVDAFRDGFVHAFFQPDVDDDFIRP